MMRILFVVLILAALYGLYRLVSYTGNVPLNQGN